MWREVELGDLGTWIAGIGTLLAVAVALWQALKANTKEREREERAQANQISAWIIKEESEFWISIRNNSATPVYEVILSLVAYQGAGPDPKTDAGFQKYLGIVPPGQTYSSIKSGGSAMGVRFGVEMAFTDNHGMSWLKEVNGRLKKISEHTPEYYGISRPVTWELPLDKLPKNIKSSVFVSTPNYIESNQRY